MKNNFKLTVITSVLILICNLMIAQECGTELLEEQIQYMNDTRIERANTDISLLSNSEEKTDLLIAAHIIRDSNGENGLSLEDLQIGIDDLNNTFEPVNFRFHLCSIDYIDDSYYSNLKMVPEYNSSTDEYRMALPYLIDDAIDVFFLPNITPRGWASFPSFKEDFGKDWIVIKNKATTNGSTLAHEIGHYFNLYHTHQGPTERLNLEIYEYELVNRSNCGDNVGDELCDTPADPSRHKNIQYSNSDCTNPSNCKVDRSNTQSCKVQDINGDFYEPDVNNVMCYSNHTNCRTYFSPQQIDRMYTSYKYERSYLSNYCEVTCNNMFIVYDWLEEVTCQNTTTTEITIYKKDEVFNYLDIQSSNDRNLYLSTGRFECSGSAVDACIELLEPTEILANCEVSCLPGNTCSDVNACNFGETGTCIYGNLGCSNPCDGCIPGCTIPKACNYNPEATVNDYSCYYGNYACSDPCDPDSCNGFTDSNACNYDPEAVNDNGSCEYGNPACINPCDESTCNEEICTPLIEQYSWLSNYVDSGECINIIDFYDGSYWHYIYVQSGNEGNLYLDHDNNGTWYGTDNGDQSIAQSFGLMIVDQGSCGCGDQPPVLGCTDPQACNYNPEATEDDGSCYNCPQPPINSSGCSEAIETYAWLSDFINPDACTNIIDFYDGSYWHYVYVQSGNEGTLYLDYDDNGTWYGTDNGDQSIVQSFGLSSVDEWQCNCDTQPTILGCTDAEACNYNPEATENDGSCNYHCPPNQGSTCNDPTACNFGETAPCTFGNEACTDPCNESTCTGLGEDCDNVFEDHPWLLNEIDPNNCTNESITVYSYADVYTFIYINEGAEGDLFYDTTFYGSDDGDFSAPANYDLTETAQWTCGCNFSNNVAKTNLHKSEISKTAGLINADSFTMYPNPTNGVVNIELTSGLDLSSLVTVYELSGKIRFQSFITGNRARLNLVDLQKGMYIVEIQNNESKNTQKLMIK